MTIDENGVATGLKEGTAVVTATNAAGLNVKATITVEKGEPDTDTLIQTHRIHLTQIHQIQTHRVQISRNLTSRHQDRQTKSNDVTDSSFKLSWTKSEDNIGVEAYEIFVNGESLGCLKETSALIGGLADRYRVHSYCESD